MSIVSVYTVFMSWHVNIFMLGFTALAEPVSDTGSDDIVLYEASRRMEIYRRRSIDSPLRGVVSRGDIFEVSEIRYLESCPAGWGKLGSEAYACLSRAKPAAFDAVLEDLPRLLEIAPPAPNEIEDYRSSLTWKALEGVYVSPSMPVYHGRRTDEFGGWLYESVDAYLAGDHPKWRLNENRDYRFTDIIETKDGYLLRKPGGKVAPFSEVNLYPASRFSGRDLTLDPVPAGQVPAFAVNKAGAHIVMQAAEDAPVLWTANHREPLNLLEEPVGDWWVVPDALGRGRHGYIHTDDVRHWVSNDRPSEVPAGDVWVDIALEQQMLGIYQGQSLVFVTLISSAREGYLTPTGLFRIYDKATAWDLASKPNSSDPYYIEQVPWVMHYYPRYALHSAFWHDDFGFPASHGCINLSPHDAQVVFDSVSPELLPGWRVVFQTHRDQGTIVRIRENTETVPRKLRN